MTRLLDSHGFQQGLSDRLPDGEVEAHASMLGVQIAGQNWLVDMADVSEVLPIPALTRVPLTKPWFRGVASVRGNLYGVADVAAYQQNGKASGEPENRVLLLAERHACNAALLVDRVLGLRNPREWAQSEVQGQGQVQYRDERGDPWRKLDIAGLLAQPDFLQIGI